MIRRAAYLAALLLQAASPRAIQEKPLAQWKLDGDLEPGGKATGRVTFVDSPIGGEGQALVLNGIDAFAQVDPAGALGIGEEDFSLSLWCCPLELRDAVLLSREGAWSLNVSRDGSLRFTAGETLQTTPDLLALNQWAHVAIVIRRGEGGASSFIRVNGTTRASGSIRAGSLDPAKAPFRIGRGSEPKGLFCGLVDDVRLYSRALDAKEIDALADRGLPWIRPRANRKPFAGPFTLQESDVVVFIGGEDMLCAQENGRLETLLTLSARGKHVLFRSMAWEGDTVYEQPRLLHFGSWSNQLVRVGATVILAQFGALESLEGKAAIERFLAAYDRLLGEFSQVTQRIVVISPPPFEKPSPPLPDLSQRNDDLRLYVNAMRELSTRRGTLFVDLFGATLEAGRTRDGIHLHERGQALTAREIAKQLGLPRSDDSELLRARIAKKNRIWLNYWRPSNWAFLNGDRIEQPSSRDHVDKRVRWFPVEVQQALALVRREEEAIEKLLEAER